MTAGRQRFWFAEHPIFRLHHREGRGATLSRSIRGSVRNCNFADAELGCADQIAPFPQADAKMSRDLSELRQGYPVPFSYALVLRSLAWNLPPSQKQYGARWWRDGSCSVG